MDGLLHILFALILTIAIECGLSLIFRSKQLTYTVFLCNLLTNPLLNFLLLLYLAFFEQEFYFVALGVLESAVVFIEGFIFMLILDYRPLKAFSLSLFFNGASLCVGLLT